MYVRPTSSRFSRGRFTPAMRATLSLPLLVSGVRADDEDPAAALDHAAAVTHRFDGRSDFHEEPWMALARANNAPAATGHRSKLPTGVRVRIRGPASATATVCSKCAESDPS